MSNTAWMRFSFSPELRNGTLAMVCFSPISCQKEAVSDCMASPRCETPSQGYLLEQICSELAHLGYLCSPTSGSTDSLLRLIIHASSASFADVASLASTVLVKATPEKYQQYVKSHIKPAYVSCVSPQDLRLCLSYHLQVFLFDHGYFRIRLDPYDEVYVFGTLKDLEKGTPALTTKFIWPNLCEKKNSKSEDNCDISQVKGNDLFSSNSSFGQILSDGYIGLYPIMVRGEEAIFPVRGSLNNDVTNEAGKVFLLPDMEAAEVIQAEPARYVTFHRTTKTKGQINEEEKKRIIEKEWNRLGKSFALDFELYTFYKLVHGISLPTGVVELSDEDFPSFAGLASIKQDTVQLITVETEACIKTIPAPCVLQSPVVQLRGTRHWISYARRMNMEHIEEMLRDDQEDFSNHVKSNAVNSILQRSQKEEEVSLYVQNALLQTFIGILEALPLCLGFVDSDYSSMKEMLCDSIIFPLSFTKNNEVIETTSNSLLSSSAEININMSSNARKKNRKKNGGDETVSPVVSSNNKASREEKTVSTLDDAMHLSDVQNHMTLKHVPVLVNLRHEEMQHLLLEDGTTVPVLPFAQNYALCDPCPCSDIFSFAAISSYTQTHFSDLGSPGAPKVRVISMLEKDLSNLWDVPLPLFTTALSLASVMEIHVPKASLTEKESKLTVYSQPIRQIKSFRKAKPSRGPPIAYRGFGRPFRNEEDNAAYNSDDDEGELEDKDIPLEKPPVVPNYLLSDSLAPTRQLLPSTFGPKGDLPCTELATSSLTLSLYDTQKRSSVTQRTLSRLTRNPFQLSFSTTQKKDLMNSVEDETSQGQISQQHLLSLESDVQKKGFILYCISNRKNVKTQMERYVLEVLRHQGMADVEPRDVSLKLLELWISMTDQQRLPYLELAHGERFLTN